jgi:hypothetical protein
LLRSFGQQYKGVARDHQLFVGRQHVKRDAAVGPRNHGSAFGICGKIEGHAEPGQPLRDSGANFRRIFADAGREDEAVWWPPSV